MMAANKANPLDMAFPDITSKPGAFLPSIFSPGEKGNFDVEKLDDNVKKNATDLQQKIMEERQKKIEAEKKLREL